MTDTAFLVARYARWGIDESHAIAAVEAATGAAPARVEAFVGGWRAKPFRATTADGEALIVRVRVSGGAANYAREAAVIERVRSLGVPAPEVVGVVDLGRLEASVQRVVPGRSLQDVARERGADDLEVVAATREAGRLLRAIHGTPIDDLALDAQPDGGAVRIAETLGEGLTPDELATLREAAHVADRVLTEARTWSVRRGLLHQDFGPDHVFVADGRVTGIIDWERAAQGDPARDTSWWTAYAAVDHGWPEPGEMRAGYGHVPRGFEARERAYVLLETVQAAAHGQREGHSAMGPGMARLAAATLARTPESRSFGR